ncbi:MAG: Do family serine endopeptidase [Kosmotoga sp.]|nr:MAG: Do family serine endopeptidase [Kosmotoga sp.]
MLKRLLVLTVLILVAFSGLAYLNPDYQSPVNNVVKECAPAVVKIDVVSTQAYSPLDAFTEEFFKKFFGEIPETQRKRETLGSGFIFSKDGYILTNEHVVTNADQITVTLLNGDKYEAKYVGGDAELDIAVIKIDPGDKELPVLETGDSNNISIGEWAIAIGNPLGFQHTVTVGVISAKGRQIPKPSGEGYYSNLIQTDASINPGNSGGPLLNIHGQVIGINTAIVSSQYGSALGFAIPINLAMRFVDQLIKTGMVEKAYLGVYGRTVDENTAKSIGLKIESGALITDVIKNSPADKAGLKTQDVIVKVNNLKIESFEELVAVIHSYTPESTVNLTVNRFGEEIKVEVKLGHQDDEEGKIDEERYEDNKLGMVVGKILPEDRERLSISEGINGVIVRELTDYNYAAKLGLQKDDLIVKMSINGQQYQINNIADYKKLVENIAKGDYVAIFIYRQGVRYIASFRYQG